jgi:hypothetical protein
MTFEETLKIHLQAVEDRDFDTLLSTLPEKGGEIVLILPRGSIDKSRDNFVSGHKEWFDDKSWKQEFEVINTIETAEMAVATVKYVYTEENGDSWKALLGLVFQKIDDRWVLVHDQNTPIKVD